MMRVDTQGNEFPIGKYLSVKAGAAGCPINGTFELTGRCNLNCKMCYVHEQKNVLKMKRKELSVDEWMKIAEQAKEAGLLYLLLTGGEVMIREDFIELYEKLIRMGFRLVINTNGSLMTPQIEDCFRRNPPARVNVSVYGASDETYEALCGVPVWEKVMGTIIKLTSMGVSVRTTTVLTPYNCHDMERIYEFDRSQGTLIEMTPYLFPPIRLECGKYGENIARFSAEEAGNYMVKRDRLLLDCKEQFQEKARRFLATGTGCPYENQLPRAKNEVGSKSRCGAGRHSFWLTWDGKMRPCGLMSCPEADVRMIGFEKAWLQIQEEVEKIRLPYECKNCKNRQFCKTCAAMCQSETGRFDMRPDYICRMAEAAKKAYGKALKESELSDAKEARSDA